MPKAVERECQTHWCSGVLRFYRVPGDSYEECRGCGWRYVFSVGSGVVR